jgi:hypothetical protein
MSEVMKDLDCCAVQIENLWDREAKLGGPRRRAALSSGFEEDTG